MNVSEDDSSSQGSNAMLQRSCIEDSQKKRKALPPTVSSRKLKIPRKMVLPLACSNIDPAPLRAAHAARQEMAAQPKPKVQKGIPVKKEDDDDLGTPIGKDATEAPVYEVDEILAERWKVAKNSKLYPFKKGQRYREFQVRWKNDDKEDKKWYHEGYFPDEFFLESQVENATVEEKPSEAKKLTKKKSLSDNTATQETRFQKQTTPTNRSSPWEQPMVPAATSVSFTSDSFLDDDDESDKLHDEARQILLEMTQCPSCSERFSSVPQSIHCPYTSQGCPHTICVSCLFRLKKKREAESLGSSVGWLPCPVEECDVEKAFPAMPRADFTMMRLVSRMMKGSIIAGKHRMPSLAKD